jgi:hypothetical protein
MSNAVVRALDRSTPGNRGRAVTVKRARRTFSCVLSSVVLLIVLAGFSRTLYLRWLFDVPDIPAYVMLHGIILTAWFVGVVLQTGFVAAHRTDIHRRFGWVNVGLGVATLLISLVVTGAFMIRQTAAGFETPAAVAAIRIFWANMAALLSFAIFLSMGVALRRQALVHKRLMLLAAIGVVQPAIARIRRWPMFEGVNVDAFNLGALSLLIGALAIHDLMSNRRIHPVTLIGGAFFLATRVFAQFVIAPSDAGMMVVRRLAE